VQLLLESHSGRLGLALVRLELTQLLSTVSLGVRVKAKLNLLVDERVLLEDSTTLGASLALGAADNALDFGAVDETGKVGLGNNARREEEALLAVVNRVELLDGSRSPNDKAAEVATGSKLEEVESIDRARLDTGDVAEALDEILAIGLGAVDDEGTTALAVAAAPELALTGTDLLGALDLLDIRASTNSLQEAESSGGLGDGLTSDGGGVDDQGNLGDGRDLVAASHQEGSHSGSGKSRGSSEALLALVDLDVPLAPDLGGGEHAAGTAHVTESGLTGTVSTTAGDTGDTGNSATSAPRLSRGLVTSLLADGVRLPLVLGHAGVDVLDDIRADGGAEDLGEDLSGAGGLAIGADDGNCGTGGHLVRVSGQVLSAAKEAKVSDRNSWFVPSTWHVAVEASIATKN
jgi:hypothetical protein